MHRRYLVRCRLSSLAADRMVVEVLGQLDGSICCSPTCYRKEPSRTNNQKKKNELSTQSATRNDGNDLTGQAACLVLMSPSPRRSKLYQNAAARRLG